MVVERWSILANDNYEDNILFFDPEVNIEELIKKAEKQLKKGDNIILSAFGGGFTWGAVYLKWAYNS